MANRQSTGTIPEVRDFLKIMVKGPTISLAMDKRNRGDNSSAPEALSSLNRNKYLATISSVISIFFRISSSDPVKIGSASGRTVVSSYVNTDAKYFIIIITNMINVT